MDSVDRAVKQRCHFGKISIGMLGRIGQQDFVVDDSAPFTAVNRFFGHRAGLVFEPPPDVNRIARDTERFGNLGGIVTTCQILQRFFPYFY